MTVREVAGWRRTVRHQRLPLILVVTGLTLLVGIVVELVHSFQPSPLRVAHDTCQIGVLANEDTLLWLDGIGRGSPLGVVDPSQFDCVFRALELPADIRARMTATTAADGQVEDSFGRYQASWTQTPDRGLDVAIWLA